MFKKRQVPVKIALKNVSFLIRSSRFQSSVMIGQKRKSTPNRESFGRFHPSRFEPPELLSMLASLVDTLAKHALRQT
ncbi:hypothetical protein [Paraburkholderia piptadeniae]|uniref:hypothetical protein n=1 Tax=Paraburkholderia piptadeniae TaxID=1701573 RepID=UPI001358D8B3|nr:hypothetical protein [Paraburkholderia piptadeniae]